MTNYILLLPPSEAKIDNLHQSTIYSKAREKNSFPGLKRARGSLYRHLIEFLEYSNLAESSKALELKGIHLDKAIRSDLNLMKASTLPAIHRYAGIMFKYIDYHGMNQKQKTNFNENVLFIDGMFGIIKPMDLIPDYKLKINSPIPGLNIVKFWKRELEKTLEREFYGKIIIDLLPDAHRRVLPQREESTVNRKPCTVDWGYYKIVFGEVINGNMRNAGHFSKKLKGEFINFICSRENICLEDLTNWNHSDGFYFSKKHSDGSRIVYLKK